MCVCVCVCVCACMYKMVDISAKVWNKTEVSVIKIHENDNVNKTFFYHYFIFLTQPKNMAVKLFMTWLIKKSKENTKLKK